jgi:hypothetical protein
VAGQSKGSIRNATGRCASSTERPPTPGSWELVYPVDQRGQPVPQLLVGQRVRVGGQGVDGQGYNLTERPPPAL